MTVWLVWEYVGDGSGEQTVGAVFATREAAAAYAKVHQASFEEWVVLS